MFSRGPPSPGCSGMLKIYAGARSASKRKASVFSARTGLPPSPLRLLRCRPQRRGARGGPAAARPPHALSNSRRRRSDNALSICPRTTGASSTRKYVSRMLLRAPRRWQPFWTSLGQAGEARTRLSGGPNGPCHGGGWCSPASRSQHHRAGARDARAASPLVRRRVSLPVCASLLAFFVELPKRTRVPPTTLPSRRTHPRRTSNRPVALWSREKTGLSRARGADRAERAAGPEASEISHGGVPVKRPFTPRRMHERMSRRDGSGNTLLRTGTATGLRQNHRFNPRFLNVPSGSAKRQTVARARRETVTCRCFPADRAPRLADDLFRDYCCHSAYCSFGAPSASSALVLQIGRKWKSRRANSNR
jgi:hypothetical protein